MSRLWILATVAAMVVCGNLAFAVEPADDLKNIASKQEVVIKKLDDIMNRVISIDNRLLGLEKANTDGEKEVRELRRQLESLRYEMNTLRSQLANQGTTSQSSPLNSGAAATAPVVPAGMSVLQIRNDFPSTMEVIVNGKTISLLPNQTGNVNITPGTFTFRVVGVDTADRQRTVALGKVYHARIYPVTPEVPVVTQ
jgi:hypothetical protein